MMILGDGHGICLKDWFWPQAAVMEKTVFSVQALKKYSPGEQKVMLSPTAMGS
jgi:hypothetical protein